MKVELIPWTEKYRPKIIDEYVFPSDFSDNEIEKIKNYVTNKFIDQNYIFFGRGGTGKTTLANILVKHITGINQRNYYKVTGRRIDDIDQLKVWIKQSPINSKVKLVIIEEIDRLSNKAITELKSLIEDANKLRTYFIGLTNNLSDLQKRDPHFLQRFIIKKFTKLPLDRTLNFVFKILDNENVKYEKSKIEELVSALLKQNKSLREIIQVLQYSTNPVTKVFDYSTAAAIVKGNEYTDIENEIVKNIEKFITILDSITNIKQLGLFITTFNITKLKEKLEKSSDDVKRKFKSLYLLISIYDDISKLLFNLDGKNVQVDYKYILETLLSNPKISSNPFYGSLIKQSLIELDYNISPENRLLSLLYEFANTKFEILKTAAIFKLDEF